MSIGVQKDTQLLDGPQARSQWLTHDPYHQSAPALSAFCDLPFNPGADTTSVPILQLGNLRHREVNPLAQCHPAGKWHFGDWNQALWLWGWPLTMLTTQCVAHGGHWLSLGHRGQRQNS